MPVYSYKKKPVIVDALQYDGHNYKELKDFVGNALFRVDPTGVNQPSIHTLEGDHLVIEGDYVIKGIKGEFYPCKEDIFHKTYEMVG